MTSVKTLKTLPSFLYGTAWKKIETRDLVKQALLAGFRGVDTAAQPKHYREDLVGDGIRDALELYPGKLTREDLYIQTKFTPIHGQDPSDLPYDRSLSIAEQVHASVKSSLQNLKHSKDPDQPAYIDCLVLHSPFPSIVETQQAWTAMETHVPVSVRTIGVSNVYSLFVLRQLYDFATIKPKVLQNRFYRDSGYDADIRVFCREKAITYQGFWTLTANPHLLKSDVVGSVAEAAAVSRPVALYALVLGLGNTSVLNGTTNMKRMHEDLDGVQAIRKWKDTYSEAWNKAVRAFEGLLA
ncbi:unnamed protein product [Zymoseptoria tritici ST99CH_1E4]|uniref:NADP-dependent oxidoreductase domain-containing protein n=1 Tax=Zymoseptoria tritici ST99CH_1E4 TaxID=1276532 RepID=A0A2H1G6R4_ZYMTR|nr:unnamed protein product [Zymoseptoria tritici ST99CH_1E4]